MISKQIAGSSGAQLGEWGGGRGARGAGLPCHFLKIEQSVLILKTGPEFIHLWIKFSIQNVF